MKKILLLTFLHFSISSFCFANSIELKKTMNYYCSYFPANENTTLVYQSSFGESISNYKRDGENILCMNEADKFKYRQILSINKDGVYVKETYQFLKLFLFIKKENRFTYGKPLLRLPFPIEPGKEWQWEGDEYSGCDTNKVHLYGKIIGKETISTKAGQFETIKIETRIEDSANTKNIITEWYAENIGLIKAKIVVGGGGLMGMVRDILGYGTIDFELKEIRKN